MFSMNPLGYISSVFTYKNGTPRQPSLCPYARGTITIQKSIFNNPEHSLENLDDFSHVWIIFIFHKNNNSFSKAKVKPPRLNGKKVGVFSTRSPYRPNPIGLTLAKLDKVEGSTVHLSGIDLLDGTPVLDIKPFIPSYDIPDKYSNECHGHCKKSDYDELCIHSDSADQFESEEKYNSDLNIDKNIAFEECPTLCLPKDSQVQGKQTSEKAIDFVNESNVNSDTQCVIRTSKIKDEICFKPTVSGIDNLEKPLPMCNQNSSNQDDDLTNTIDEVDNNDTKTANWIQSPPIDKLVVRFTNYAVEQLDNFTAEAINTDYCLKYLKSPKEVYQAIIDILCQDPRSVYRRKHCIDSLYYFVVDVVHVTAWFNGNVAEVVRLQPVTVAEHLQNK